MRISDWSSDVCSSDLRVGSVPSQLGPGLSGAHHGPSRKAPSTDHQSWNPTIDHLRAARNLLTELEASRAVTAVRRALASAHGDGRQLEQRICKKIGRGHVGNPGNKAHLQCRRLPAEKKNQ